MIPATNGPRFEHLIGLARDLEKNARRYGTPKKYKAYSLQQFTGTWRLRPCRLLLQLLNSN
jgi:hypothetical protein